LVCVLNGERERLAQEVRQLRRLDAFEHYLIGVNETVESTKVPDCGLPG
jgi:hypothetical protein